MKIFKHQTIRDNSPPHGILFLSLIKLNQMKKIVTFSFIVSLLSIVAHGQITKHNWLVGGNANFSRQQEKLISSDIKSTDIQINPNFGYFPIDKFSIGLRPGFGYLNLKTNTYQSKTTSWAIGPFVRYYFLSPVNRTNFLAETSYQYFSSSNGDSQNLLLFSAGPVIFFNQSVGVELTANYKVFKTINTEVSSKTFFLAVGLQVHLEKE